MPVNKQADTKRRLEEITEKFRRKPLMEKLTPEFLEFINQSIVYFMEDDCVITSITMLYRAIVDVAKSDYKSEVSKLPGERAFREWARQQIDSRMLSGNQKPETKANTKNLKPSSKTKS